MGFLLNGWIQYYAYLLQFEIAISTGSLTNLLNPTPLSC